jgi:lipoprotein NlpD
MASPVLACGLSLLAVLLLGGCTASWQAPVETRSTRHPVITRPVPEPQRRADEYRVQRGDTLYTIAWQRGLDYRDLAAWNGIRPPYRIYVGQTLRLAQRSASRVPSAPPHGATHSSGKPPAQRKVQAPQPSPAPATGRAETSKPAAARPASASGGRSDQGDAVATTRLSWQWPTNGTVVSTFKAGEPLRNGIRVAGRVGDKIRAAERGKVVYAGSGLIGYGRLIIVKHNDNYLSAYGHNRDILVREGDQVAKGQDIATMGAANDGSPQLHFEIRRDGKPVDPLGKLPRR